MLCIFLDIASHSGLLALVSEKEIIVSREVNTRIRDHELIPIVEELLSEAGWDYEDLTNVACVVGPGGFTSLRVAVSFANTLIDQLGIPGTGIHLSEVYFARNPDAFWFHATKRDSLFVQGGASFARLTPQPPLKLRSTRRLWPASKATDAKEWNEPTLVTLDEFKEKVPQGSEWMGELLDEQMEALDSKQLKKAELKSVTEILPKFIFQQKFERKPLEPWYGRGG